MKIKNLHQRGDTIVEVLIAIAIISSVLAGAFVLTQKSAVANRSSQERGEAGKLVESQLESLRGLADLRTPAAQEIFTKPTAFCVSQTGSLPTPAADCTFTTDGSLAAVTPGSLGYLIRITRTACPAGSVTPCGIFTVQATWDKLSGSGQNSVSVVYRVYGSN